MPDRPLDTRESRADNSVLIGVVLAAVLAILLIFGSRMFNAGEKERGRKHDAAEHRAAGNGRN